MYRVVIYDKDLTELTHLFQGGNFRSLEYTNELNKAGSASFVIQLKDAKATQNNLRPFNRVKIYDGDTVRWFGYIDSLEIDTNEIEVRCIGMLGFLKKRIYSSGYIVSSDVKTELSDMITSMNATDDTGLTEGTNNLTNTVAAVEISRSLVYDALSKLAGIADGAEYEVDTDGAINLVAQLGSDISDSVIFRYDVDNLPLSTIYDFKVEVDGDDMVNAVLAIGAHPLAVTRTDATSIAAYGRLEKPVNLSETGNTVVLQAEGDSYVEEHKNEFYVPTITPNIEKIDADDFQVGDTVGVQITNGFIDLDKDHRIIKKIVTVSDQGVVKVDVDIAPEGVNKLPSTFVDSIIDLDERIRLLEGAI